ncbi:hypothetical protein [Nocardioides sp.]|uniref:hypothetical protein n=1 Tax=Nocardioides sp. TaxID=35761 RepID=UPI0025F15F24|nr:hypothetical protein [Nocardioides sp.]
MADEVKMEPAAALPFIDRFNSVRDALTTASSTVLSQASKIESACGEFSGSVSPGADAYQISWRESLRVAGTSAGVIAGNINTFTIEITRLDNELSPVPDIGPRPPGRPGPI